MTAKPHPTPRSPARKAGAKKAPPRILRAAQKPVHATRAAIRKAVRETMAARPPSDG